MIGLSLGLWGIRPSAGGGGVPGTYVRGRFPSMIGASAATVRNVGAVSNAFSLMSAAALAGIKSVGSASVTFPVTVAAVVHKAPSVDVKWNSATAQSGIALSTDKYHAYTTSGYAQHGVLGAPAMPTSGKWWVEYTSDTISDVNCNQGVGFARDTSDFGNLTTGVYLFMTNGSQTLYLSNVPNGGQQIQLPGPVKWSAGVNVVGFGYDADNNTLVYQLNGGTVSSPITIASLGTPAYPVFWAGLDGGAGWTINSGRVAWAHQPPAGYIGLSY